jgi:hypothetical protein
MIDEPVEPDPRDHGRYRGLPSGIAWTRPCSYRMADPKGGVRSLSLLARKKAQLLGALPSDRSLAVATQEGVE